MAVLITGGAGFIGSNLALKLIERNYKVVIMRNIDKMKKDLLIIDGRRLLVNLEKELMKKHIRYITVGKSAHQNKILGRSSFS